MSLINQKLNISLIINPYFIYCIAFSVALITYFFNWSNLYPKLTLDLVFFILLSFIPFIILGYKHHKRKTQFCYEPHDSELINNTIFILILILGTINIIGMGYIPLLNNEHDYRNFGVPVIDTLFNTLSIFFSAVYFHTYLKSKKPRLIIYGIVLILIQILILRRGTIIWILTSWTFLYALYKEKKSIISILIAVLIIPVSSYLFGYFGDLRSNIGKSTTLTDFEASDDFKSKGISHYHYMTYLYLSSPLANLQENIKEEGGLEKDDFKSFLFYSIIPPSITLRIDDLVKLKTPEPDLINHSLIVGTIFMVAHHTMGWTGMLISLIFIIAYIAFCLLIVKPKNSFKLVNYALLTTATALLIFDNMFFRMDVIIMLFIYPALFQYILNNINTGSRPA